MPMKSFKTQNYYDILGVNRAATAEEIRSAYEICRHTFQENSLATYSLFSDQENREILSLIAKAFETLFNPESRRSYDALLSQQDGEAAPGARRGAPAGGAQPGQPPGLHAAAGHGALPRARPEGDLPRRASPAGPPPGSFGAEPTRGAARPPASPPGAGGPASLGTRSDAPALQGTPPARVPPIQMPPASVSSAHVPPASVSSAHVPPASVSSDHFAPKPALVPEAHSVNPAREEFLKSVTQFNGAALKKARQIHGMALEELAERSKIRRAYLEYIEEEQFQFLPAPVYVKGFVTLMATILGLPAERAAKEYMLIFRAKRPDH